MFSSPLEVGERLRSAGYIADPVTVVTIFLAAQLNKPILLEGRLALGLERLR